MLLLMYDNMVDVSSWKQKSKWIVNSHTYIL